MQLPSIPLNHCLNFPPKSHSFPPKLYHFIPKFSLSRTKMASPLAGFRIWSSSQMGGTESLVSEDGLCTLLDYVGKGGANVGDDLVVLFSHLQYASKRIAALVASPFNSSLGKHSGFSGGNVEDSGRDKPKPLDIVANEIILSSLRNSGKVAVMASEEDDAPVWIADDGPFVVVTDPLDGSRNIDASIPTGTIFGIYNRLAEVDHLPVEEKATINSLQSGTRLVAAGYVLYSSATILCTSFGIGTHAFTLDHSTGDFILTHPSIKIPPRGQIYSVNDARYFDWPEGLRQYIDTVRQGKGKYPKKYSARYICSLVADFHRTLLYGGVAMNPRDHLRLVYEANPLSFLVEHAGGRGSDGKSKILSIQPVKLHQRLPLFLGSPLDMEELESYGDVQQTVNPAFSQSNCHRNRTPSPDSARKRHKGGESSEDRRRDAAAVVSDFVDGIVKEQKQQKAGGVNEDVEMDPDEVDMIKMMGIPVGFDSTERKPVADNDVSGVRVVMKRMPRQYMNCRGGFNRPLPAERNR